MMTNALQAARERLDEYVCGMFAPFRILQPTVWTPEREAALRVALRRLEDDVIMAVRRETTAF